ncbi:sodium:calcium antiporter [Candidatus Bathyarchaeota archaeon]|nr:sodium:calcium antiporter [Candidatus Bathyarchaeota archaeon]
MVIDIILAVSAFLGGVALLAYSSDKAVRHSVSIASALRISPLMIGLIVVSLGTDLPEIVNSITSSAMGHGDINVGDSFGSVLVQITLVLGLVALLGGTFRVKRNEIAVIGSCELLALIAAVSMVEKGYISRMNAIFLVASFPLLMLIVKNVVKKEYAMEQGDKDPKLLRHFVIAVIGYVGVAIGAYVVVNSVVALSAEAHIPEYLISFFVVAIGTSLPELAVDLTAVRRKQYEIAIGDAIGSCIVDAGLSIGIGPLIFPITVSARLAETTGLYALLASIVVLLTLAIRQKLDRKAGVFFIILYGLSYSILFV